MEAADRFRDDMHRLLPHAVPVLLGAAGLGLIAWHWPFSPASTAAPGAATVRISNGQFVPRWVRLPVGGCVSVENVDQVAYTIHEASGAPTVPAGGHASLCFAGVGIVRARTSGLPDAGGIVLLDPPMAQ